MFKIYLVLKGVWSYCGVLKLLLDIEIFMEFQFGVEICSYCALKFDLMLNHIMVV